MAKKDNPNQLSFNLNKDERIPKLIGVLLLLFSAYLFIAFSSYLFTWKYDFAEVDERSLGGLLGPGFHAENLLGRLGAIVSYFFFDKLFGLPSFILVYLFAVWGWSLVKRIPIRTVG